MSKKEKAVLKCDLCGHQFDTEIWTEIVLGKDVELENKIFGNEINFFECYKCDNRGFVSYPIKIEHKKGNERAIIIPSIEEWSPHGVFIDDENGEINIEEDKALVYTGFYVVKIGNRKPRDVFNNFDDLRYKILRWSGQPPYSYGGPPEEADIEEGLKKGIINEKEAEKIRNADWDSIDEKMLKSVLEEENTIDLDDEEDEALDLCLRLTLELDRSRKVISIGKR